MLRVTITNERQRREFSHREGRLLLGRAPREAENSCTVDDAYVSREQLQIEELPGDKVRIDNIGRNIIMLADGTTVTQGNHTEVSLPTRLTVGRTVLDVVAEVLSPEQTASAGQTLFVSSLSELPDLILESICTYYPYPLAYGYRLLGSITNPAERYREQLRTVENLVAFIGTVSLAAAVDLDGGEQLRQRDQSILDYWRGGISPGNWLDLSIHSLQSTESAEGNALVRSLKGLRINESHRGFGKLLRELIKAKNDHKHDRGPSVDEEYVEHSKKVAERLRKVFDLLSFLVHHPLLLVEDVNPKRRSSEADVLFLKCRGDHPGFATEKAVYPATLRKGDLYIEVAERQLIPLYPFMHAQMCRQCKSREFFFIDRIDKEKQARLVAGLKSFERGHTDTDSDMGQEMAQLFAAAS